MDAYGYIRLSKWDEDTTSPQRQRKALEDFCKTKGWHLVETFEDIDVSAYNGKHRPGLSKMLSRLDQVQAVVFMRLDRLARSVADFQKIREQCQSRGVQLVSTDLQIDTSSPIGKAMETIVSAFAQLESDTISARSKQMHSYKKEQGEWVGRVPFGFKRNGKGIEVDPERFAILEQAASRYVAGESLRSIGADMGISHPWLATMLKSDRVIDALPQPLAGSLVQTLSERGRDRTKAKRSLLGGIARCSICGAGLTVVADAARRGRNPWAAYACRANRHVSISKPWLDAFVTKAVISAIDTGEIVKRLEKRKPSKTMASSEVEARLEILERDFYERGIIERDSYLRRREGLLKRLKDARNQEQDSGIDLPKELALNLGERWADLSIHEQRGIVQAVLHRVEVSKATGKGPISENRVKIVWR